MASPQPRLPHVATSLDSDLRLSNGSRVAVIGGGPSGSFFSYFLLSMAERAGMNIAVDIYDPRDFSELGQLGCNKCGGIIYEALVQSLATDGIILPPSVVQQGLASYTLHTDEGIVRIKPPSDENPIASVRRGAGPRGAINTVSASFDAHLMTLAEGLGARFLRERVTATATVAGRPCVTTKEGRVESYDLLVGAVGVNSSNGSLLEGCATGYVPPATTRAYITEILLGADAIEKGLGDSMHVFLLNLPGLKFAAIIPKGDYATVCLLGREVGQEMVEAFFRHPEVQSCFPAGWTLDLTRCRCAPSIIVGEAKGAFGDRFVAIGDCYVSRLYKDGIGNAYRTAKAAAQTAFLSGISKQDFQKHYRPVCAAVARDNRFGKVVFLATSLVQKWSFLRHGVVCMTNTEQVEGVSPRMSSILWDTFTGNASFRNILKRALHPVFLVRLLLETSLGRAILPIPLGQGRS